MQQLEKILKKYGFPVRETISMTGIEKIEELIKFNIPEDYRYYLEHFKGAEEYIGLEMIRLWDLDELITLNRDYRILESLPNTLGIGNNSGGEFIAIEYSETGRYRIVLSPFIDLDRQYHVDIGGSFTEILMRLDSGKEWFLL